MNIAYRPADYRARHAARIKSMLIYAAPPVCADPWWLRLMRHMR